MVPPPCEFAFKKKACNVPLYEKPQSLKVRRYAACKIYLNHYLASFPGATMADKIGVNEINGIVLKIMHNSWYNQACVQCFDCGSFFFKL